jgi:YjbE family integral membrane protein
VNTTSFFLGILQITLLDLALCADNIGIIALATKNLNEKSARRASLLGIAGAILLRIYFAACISVFFKARWLPIKLLGGFILIKVTWDLIKPRSPKTKRHTLKESEKFWDAVFTVLIADITMSLDNVLAIAGASNGNIMLIFFGILLNVPIIFFGSQFVINLMKKSAVVVYFGASILAYTSFNMIIEDYWFNKIVHLNHLFASFIPISAALLTFLYGLYLIKYKKHKDKLHNCKVRKVS